MASQPSPDLSEFPQQLSDLLKKLRELKDDASAQQQQEVFALGCQILTALVTAFQAKNSALNELDNAAGPFKLGIDPEDLQEFVDKETDLLRRLKFDTNVLQDAAETLKKLTDKELEVARLNAAEVINDLTEFQQILCGIEVLSRNGWTVSPELVKACYWPAVDVCVIAGNLLSVPAAAAAGPLAIGAAVLLAIGSVSFGAKSLKKRLASVRGLFEEEKRRRANEQNMARLKGKPGPRLK